MGKNLYWLVFILFLTVLVYPQDRIGKHTAAEWRYIIDTTWGMGKTTEEKLQIFDAFWNAIDQRYAGFRGIEDNWQQLKSYRDTVAAGVSRGRFQGILNYLVCSLHDGHVYMCNNGIASKALNPGTPLFLSCSVSYPLYSWNLVDHFGAALTPLPDSTLLVYSAIENHPLGLVPGDVVLGYDGKLWKDLYKKLLEVQFPIPFWFVMSGSERAGTYQLLQSAGMNWHLFDTVDIVKYESGDTIHLSTDLLSNPMPGTHVIDQMPIEGVPFPDGGTDEVSWGHINGTKIGYIYVWGWSSSEDFLNAVNALMPDNSSKGLIIDMRLNEGGVFAWDPGFQRLFNQDVSAMHWYMRLNSSAHFAIKDILELRLSGTDQQLYDRPIAVLCGPWTLSGGDMSVHFLRKHPMVRTFGLPTNGSFGTIVSIDEVNQISSEWTTGICDVACFEPPDNVLIHKSVPVDEEVWLTKDGVAKGEDDVVKKALEWINNLVYGHNLQLNKVACKPSDDTLKISTYIENPNSHLISSKVYIKNLDGNFIDSVELHKTGQSGKSEIWGVNCLAPDFEDIFSIALAAKDITDSKTWTTPNISRFTTAGPLTIDSIEFVKGTGKYFSIRTFVHNHSNNMNIKNVLIRLILEDPWVTSISPSTIPLPNISPDSIVATTKFNVLYIDSLFPGYFNFKLEIMSNRWVYWTDSMRVTIPAVGIDNQANLPLTFKLEQNYPNPFNPTTTIKYSIPKQSYVTLKVYNILGSEIKTLVNEEKSAGNYQVKFNAANLPSGVYFYRIQAGSFNQVRKMLLIK